MPHTQTQPSSITSTPPMVECHGCGELFPSGRLTEHEGHVFCDECMSEKGYTRCSRCGDTVHEDETRMTADEDIICESCYDSYYFTCAYCERIYRDRESLTTDNGDSICESCYNEYYFTCEACDNIFHNDDCYSTDDGCYCESCHSDRECTCEICGESVSRDRITAFRGVGNVCDECQPDTRINQYGYKPNPVFFGEGKFHMGVELEISCENIITSLNSFNEPSMERLYMKEDSSVPNGFEIVSHPMTLEEHKSFDWVKLCKGLVDSGATGNKNNHGIHIHISKLYLSELNRLKLSWFVCHHVKKLVPLTRRSECYHEARDAETIISVLKSQKKYANSNRFEILNWIPRDTVEFRLPLSTLRGETLLAILEFCDAVVKFVQTDVNFITLQDCWDTFMTWCKDNNYKCLVGYYVGYPDGGYDEI